MSEKEQEKPSEYQIPNLQKQADDQEIEFFVNMAKGTIDSLSLMQDLKRRYPKNSEEEILISAIIHDEVIVIKKLMQEAERAKKSAGTKRP